jgi:hypothetical protein
VPTQEKSVIVPRLLDTSKTEKHVAVIRKTEGLAPGSGRRTYSDAAPVLAPALHPTPPRPASHPMPALRTNAAPPKTPTPTPTPRRDGKKGREVRERRGTPREVGAKAVRQAAVHQPPAPLQHVQHPIYFETSG